MRGAPSNSCNHSLQCLPRTVHLIYRVAACNVVAIYNRIDTSSWLASHVLVFLRMGDTYLSSFIILSWWVAAELETHQLATTSC